MSEAPTTPTRGMGGYLVEGDSDDDSSAAPEEIVSEVAGSLARRAVRDLNTLARTGRAIAEEARRREGDTPGRRVRLTASFMQRAERLQSMLAAARLAPRPAQSLFAAGTPEQPTTNGSNALIPASSAALFPPMPVTPQRNSGNAMQMYAQQQQQQWGQLVNGLNTFAQRHEQSLRRQEDNTRELMAQMTQERQAREQSNAAILGFMQQLAGVSSPPPPQQPVTTPPARTTPGLPLLARGHVSPDFSPSPASGSTSAGRGQSRQPPPVTPSRPPRRPSRLNREIHEEDEAEEEEE
ncbi:hypothetical protein CP532_2038 [Ophiocordyceps camponoti-leonardi (nom. inval.)]|nr:hypothetical protein CP532_2038 [Ophiocordyceps camponoti-leonardi (nom. inval.)]